jgi:hypothetical protein
VSRRAWLAAAAVAFVCLGVVTPIATGAATQSVLVVDDEGGDALLVTPVEEGTEITVEYTHSVEKTLVSDVYAVDDGRLLMTRMEFSSYGAGLPSSVPVTEVDGRYVYYPPERHYDPLRVTTGYVADHDLVVGEQRYELVDIADGGTVELSVETRLKIPQW